MAESVVKDLVEQILKNPQGYPWTVQGLGMLRLYLGDSRRLHIWDSNLKVEKVSQMHTHPWDFRSLIVAGEVVNCLYEEVDTSSGVSHFKQKIFCGEGGGLVGEPESTIIKLRSTTIYFEKEVYKEEAHEIHVSDPSNGTVTIIDRQFKDDVDHAYVYWENGDWVSAEPRPATYEEIEHVTQNSLEKWF